MFFHVFVNIYGPKNVRVIEVSLNNDYARVFTSRGVGGNFLYMA